MEHLHIDWVQIVVQLAGFGLFVWLLSKFAWKPLLAVLDERRRRIEDDLRQAAQSKEELAHLQQELTHRLSKIDEEARARIRQAIQEGRRIATEIQEEARGKTQEIIAKSKEAIELELAKAKVSLRDELADMTIEAVERLLKQKLDPQSDWKLVESILEELGGAATRPP